MKARRPARPPSHPGVRDAWVARHEGPATGHAVDRVAVEEPLEIRLAGDPLAVTMRTPGSDRELTLGFLFAEGVVAKATDVGTLSHCGRPGEEGFGNVIDVTPAPGTVFDPERTRPVRRGTLTSSACGVCGRQSIDDLLLRSGRVTRRLELDPDVVTRLPSLLSEHQHGFTETGGLHAAGAATAAGHLVCVHEDVGRHNAVDKVLGRLLLDGRVPASDLVLVVSGRVSFEIVQKAVAAGIPFVVGISAPTSLAIETAERAGATLVGFARGEAFNVYSNAEGIRSTRPVTG